MDSKQASELDLIDDKLWHSRFNPFPALAFAILGGVVFTGMSILGLVAERSTGAIPPPEPLDVALIRFPFICALVFAIFYSLRLIGLRFTPEDAICVKCHKAQLAPLKMQCACGGKCEDLYLWKKIPNQPSKENKSGPP